MTLLINYNNPKILMVAKIVFEEQFKRDPKLEIELDERRKKLMYDDVVYNISYLFTAVHFKDEKLFIDYSIWIYRLLCNIMKDFNRNRIMEQMIDHYYIMHEIIESKLRGELEEDELSLCLEYLEKAIDTTRKEHGNLESTSEFSQGKNANLRRLYLNALLNSKTREAHSIIREAREQGLSIVEIYEDVLGKVMHEVGELWHKNMVGIDREHYATSVTQMVMAQFYDEIFSKPKSNYKLISCAVGSELHELGIRMISDMFEYSGWDTYYLGAGVPKEAVLKAIEEYKPDLLAFSVTMTHYLKDCYDLIKLVKEKYKYLPIAVGGQAFLSTDNLWEKWDIDYYATSGDELVKWAKSL